MTIQLVKATYISGSLEAASSQHTLDSATEAALVHAGIATWVGGAPDVTNRYQVFAKTEASGATVLYGAGGVGFPYVVAALQTTNTGAQNIAALQAAHDSLAGYGGVVLMPAGAFDLAGTVEIDEGFLGEVGNQNVIFRGAGMGATRLTQLTEGVSTFKKTAGHAHGFEDFYLYGPATTDADSVGIEWSNAAGGGVFKNVWIENFGAGMRFIDATAMTFINVMLHGNDINFQAGFNCDIFQFIGGRNQGAITSNIQIGYLSAGHPAQPMQCNPMKFIGVRIAASPLGIHIPDYGASNIEFDSCYTEDLDQICIMGDASTAVGPKQVQFRNCFFTWVGGTSGGGSATQFKVNVNSTQQSTLTIEHCRTDTTGFSGTWVELGRDSRLMLVDNQLITSGAAIAWNGTTYTADVRQNLTVGMAAYQLFDGSVLGASVIPLDIRMTNGTNETYATFKRLNATNGAELGIASAAVQDINGQFVAFKGPLRPATPSAALPTAAAAYRGVMAYQEGAGGVADTVVCCMKDAAGAYSWKVVATG